MSSRRRDRRVFANDSLAMEFAALAEQQWPQMVGRWLQPTQQAAVTRHQAPAQVMDPEQAGAYLAVLRADIQDQISHLTQSYPAVQWLWYLRRLPDLFEGDLATTGPSDRALMELAAATSRTPCPGLPITDGEVRFPVTDGIVRRVLRLCAMTIALADTEAAIRRTGKGLAARARPNAIPATIPDQDISAAITLYDRRVAANGTGLLAPGTRLFSQDVRDEDPATIMTAYPVPWQGLTSWQGTPADGRQLKVWGRYHPAPLSPRDLRTVLERTQGQAWWDPALPSVIALLQALCWYLLHHTSNGWISLVRYGYIVTRWDLLAEIIDRILPALRADLETWFEAAAPADAQEVLATITAQPAPWDPAPAGPLLHRAGQDVLVDVQAAAHHLLPMSTISSTTQGALVNTRGFHFEEVVQDLIDRSPWKPSPTAPVRGLDVYPEKGRGRTDFDAVGEKDDVLLLVSCKSEPYTAQFDAGDYRTVRNAASRAEEAVATWNKVHSTLTRQPVGTNYDLSRYKRIIAVVCYPHIPYTRIGAPTQVLDTSPTSQVLRNASGFSELAAWLHDTANPNA